MPLTPCHRESSPLHLCLGRLSFMVGGSLPGARMSPDDVYTEKLPDVHTVEGSYKYEDSCYGRVGLGFRKERRERIPG